MRLRVLAIAALVAVIAAGVFVAHFVVPSPYSAAQNRAIGSHVNRFDAQAVFATYVGKWEVHGSLLTITAQHTGLEQWNVGRCTQASAETRMCNGNTNITFTVNPDGSIKRIIQSAWYTQWDGTPVPAGFQSDPADEQAGDAFELQHEGAHLLYTTWFGARQSSLNAGNRYWCDAYASHAGWQQCGA